MKYTIILLLLLLQLSTKGQIIVEINDSITYQQIVGFGWAGAMKPWWTSGPFYDDTFLNSLVNDIGLTVNRNEFDVNDTNMFHNKQKDYFIALQNKAKTAGEPLTVIHTVWTPPAKWKANNSICDNTCSSKCNNNKDLSPTCGGTKNYLLENYYHDYVNLCADFLKYTFIPQTGIKNLGFSLQNELDFNEPYSSCVYTPEQYNKLLNITGTVFKKELPSVILYGPEDMANPGKLLSWTNVIYNDPETVDHLDALAVHGYVNGVTASSGDQATWSALHSIAALKKKQLWMTETSGYSADWNASPGAFDIVNAIYLALKYGRVSEWTWWLFGSPTMVSDKRYSVFKNYFRYIRPGALQIDSRSTSPDIGVLAFKNSGNSDYSAIKPQLTVVLINFSTSSKTVKLNGRQLPSSFKARRTSSTENCITLSDVSPSSIQMPAKSITTLTYTGVNKSPTINTPTDTVILKNSIVSIPLSNVTAGHGENSSLIVTAISDNKKLLPKSIAITGTAPNYTLSLDPGNNESGQSMIRIFVNDGGTDFMNTTVTEFKVKVIPFINRVPSVDSIKDIVVGLNHKNFKNYIQISGISDGDDGSQQIERPYISLSDETIIRLPYINYTMGTGNASLEFYPNKLGSTLASLTIKDNGGTDLGGIDTRIITFRITVVEEAPLLSSNTNMEQTQVSLFPNPAHEILYVESSFAMIEISLINFAGIVSRTIYLDEITSTGIELKGIESGLYMLRVKLKNGQEQIHKLMIYD